ncbi:tetratricopeptide repeat protein [Variovorax sp. J2P1-59]|uniref:tetratricopeptide repeat protein n=1 Tax=Variovorax flavidus TaxID=3053501 RepID=UPI0025791FA7|nr:tetratricopeptide repeat protein [Variovorax sp. J2P1-59]MDM0075551.1 tetratricopeptide repeat protein [Variovorax sp. J2P1-59]
MITGPDLATGCVQATDGVIAAINLRSTLAQSWNRFWQAPLRPGIAECVIEQEQLHAQFLGDLDAYGRLEQLAGHLLRMDPDSARSALVDGQVAASTHRFADARACLSRARDRGCPALAAERLEMSIDQACGESLEDLLGRRLRLVRQSGRLEDWVPLGSLLADLGDFDEAERAYCRALGAYRDVSPFAVAWVCFLLGTVWGERVAEPKYERAARWYAKAIDCLPGYVKARVHLAEIRSAEGRSAQARALLAPALASGDPEVSWRLSDVAIAQGRPGEAHTLSEAARSGFERLLAKHPLAFADHAAEFYAGSGNDARRAFELTGIDLANRPTLRAFEKAHAAALEAGEALEAASILAAARRRWESAPAFRQSPLAATPLRPESDHAH